jgi:HAD superfamily hydrolase (TIGR01509 family)
MLNPTLNTLIFDLDNTLIDRNNAMQLTIEEWLRTQGYTTAQNNSRQLQPALIEIMQQDRWGYADRREFCTWLLQTYAEAYAGIDRTVDAHQQLLDYLLRNIIHHIQPDPMVNAVLNKASISFKLVLATNGGSTTQRAKLRKATLQNFFRPGTVFISAETGFQKPDKQFFEQIIHDLQLDPEKTMVIGDDPVNDIAAARSCGLSTCWVSHGRPATDNCNSEQVIQNITEFGQWIRS